MKKALERGEQCRGEMKVGGGMKRALGRGEKGGDGEIKEGGGR